MEPSDAFLSLQPFCVDVCKERNAEVLNALTEAIDRITDDETLQRLQDYVLYPLKLIFKLRERRNFENADDGNNPKDKAVEAGIRCLRAVLKRTVIDSVATAVDLLTSLLAILGHPKNGGRVDAAVGEDLKEAVVSAAESLVNSCDDGVRKQLCAVRLAKEESDDGGHWSIDIAFFVTKRKNPFLARVWERSSANRIFLNQVDFLPLWGHAVATLLSLGENEMGVNLVTAALKTLIALEEALPRDEAAVCFATFLPGIVVACLKLTTRDEKQNHRINCEALRLLTKSISLVLRNNPGQDKQRIWETLNEETSSSSPKSNLLIEPTTEWRLNTWEKLGAVINKLSQSVSGNHPHWKVRLESLTLVHTIVEECQLEDYEKHCSNALVEMTVSRLDDEDSRVKQLAEKVLERLGSLGIEDVENCPNNKDSGNRTSKSGSRLLGQAATASLERATRHLPNAFRQVGDGEKLRHVRSIKGYLTVLGKDGVAVALMSPSGVVNKLLLAFMQVLEMDVDDLTIIQRLPANTLNTINEPIEGFKPKIRFRLFNDDRVLTAIEDCLQLLGRLARDNLYALCDYLVEHLESKNNDDDSDEIDRSDGEGSFYAKQMIFIINQILIGAAKAADDKRKKKKKNTASSSLQCFVKDTLLPLYLSDSLFHAQCESSDKTTKHDLGGATVSSSHSRFLVGSTPSSLIQELHSSVASTSFSATAPRFNSNILLVVLSVEGVSLCAQATKLAFRPMLIKALYPVVEKVASELTMIQDAAYSALRQMAAGCGYASVGELLLSNSDYVINQLRSELRHGFIFSNRGDDGDSNAPRVLAAMLKNAGPDLLPLLKDTVEEVLLCLDTTSAYQPKRAKVFLKVLSALVFYVNQWFTTSLDVEKNDKEESVEPEFTKEYWVDYAKNLQTIETLNVDEDDDKLEANAENDVDDQFEEPTPEDPPPPYHVRVTEQVMTRCIYYMPDEDPRIRVLVLDLMRNCCEALAAHENTLLPLAHLCWSSFVCRLKDKDRHVALNAFETLLVLSRTCGDFLLQRFTKDVLPALTTFMTSQGMISAGLRTRTRPFAGFRLKDEEERKSRIRDDGVGTGAAYKFTVAYKLQLAVLRGIDPLCRTIKVRVETGLDQVVDFLLLHLRLSQPVELQDAAKDALLALGSVDKDLLWMRVSSARGDFHDGGPCPPAIEAHRRVAEGQSYDVLTEIIQNLS